MGGGLDITTDDLCDSRPLRKRAHRERPDWDGLRSPDQSTGHTGYDTTRRIFSSFIRGTGLFCLDARVDEETRPPVAPRT